MTDYSGRPLYLKLGVKPDHKVLLLDVPANYINWLGPMDFSLPELENDGTEFDFIHVFFRDKSHLSKSLPELKSLMSINGMLWVSWPKKSSPLHIDLDGNIVRESGLALGLVDSKVCAVSDDWSGLKFTYRVEERKRKEKR